MSGRKGKLYLSNVDAKGNGFIESKPSFADLPLCLLGVIISQLVLKDNIRASAVCKTWREAGLYVRLVDKPPWLMYLPKRGNLFELYDPLQQKMYTLNLPELAKSTDGYLCAKPLRTNFSSSIRLLRINMFGMVRLLRALAIPEQPSGLLRIYSPIFSMVFHLSTTMLYFFEPSSRQWIFSYTTSPPCPYMSGRFSYRYERKKKIFFLAARKGVLFKMFTCGGEKPIVYKLTLGSYKWKQINSATLDGLKTFTSLYSSEVRVNLQWMGNSVYFSRLRLMKRGFVSS
ncbi:unnamed protein product [Thlaspi arvense]|uniref:F-box domain-containing protein n=1 Tax=Thlaspi arvense TaxID=13288 RepID=A0AAU9SRL9_THLAR|nr:unnamed protein product [Thlaspi arvense]